MEHGDRARDGADELHVVLDHQHRAVARDLDQQRAGARGLLLGHAGHRLVHQQQLGVLGHHHADLQPLLLAVGQHAGLPQGLGLEADALQRLADAPPLVGRVRARPQSGEDALAAALERELDVVPHREVDEDGRRLELAADAEGGDLVLAERGEVGAAAEDHAAVLGLHPTRDHVEQGRLAGAVGADHHAQLPPVHEEVQAVEGLEALVGDGHVLQVDDRLAHAVVSLARSRCGASRSGAGRRRSRWARRASAPTTPSGMNSTTLMKRAPRNSSQTSG